MTAHPLTKLMSTNCADQSPKSCTEFDSDSASTKPRLSRSLVLVAKKCVQLQKWQTTCASKLWAMPSHGCTTAISTTPMCARLNVNSVGFLKDHSHSTCAAPRTCSHSTTSPIVHARHGIWALPKSLCRVAFTPTLTVTITSMSLERSKTLCPTCMCMVSPHSKLLKAPNVLENLSTTTSCDSKMLDLHHCQALLPKFWTMIFVQSCAQTRSIPKSGSSVTK